MTNALIFRALERNTGSVGLASELCDQTAVNPEIAALSQHQVCTTSSCLRSTISEHIPIGRIPLPKMLLPLIRKLYSNSLFRLLRLVVTPSTLSSLELSHRVTLVIQQGKASIQQLPPLTWHVLLLKIHTIHIQHR